MTRRTPKERRHEYCAEDHGLPVRQRGRARGRRARTRTGTPPICTEDYAIGLEYVGGSVLSDIAVLRADTADILAINEQAQAVTLADDYYVGQTVYAVGNAEGMGLSAVQGIISTEDELITLSIDGDDPHLSLAAHRCVDARRQFGRRGCSTAAVSWSASRTQDTWRRTA